MQNAYIYLYTRHYTPEVKWVVMHVTVHCRYNIPFLYRTTSLDLFFHSLVALITFYYTIPSDRAYWFSRSSSQSIQTPIRPGFNGPPSATPCRSPALDLELCTLTCGWLRNSHPRCHGALTRAMLSIATCWVYVLYMHIYVYNIIFIQGEREWWMLHR